MQDLSISNYSHSFRAYGVLKHCKEGRSRSTAVVIAYLMSKYQVSYEAAYEFVRRASPISKPNSSFEEQLKSKEYLTSNSLSIPLLID